jgi:cytoskeleton-associated protein 5
MAYLIQRNGVSVCAASKVFPSIAAMVADRDAVVRNAALGVVIQAYLLIGDTVFKHVGRISDKDRSLIDERIRRLPGDSHKVTEVVSKPVKQVQERVIPAKTSTSIKSRPLSPVQVKREFSLDLDDFEAKKPLSVANDLSPRIDSSSRSIINELSIMDPVQSIIALKLLEENLSKEPDSFKNGINELMSSLCTHLHLVFTSANIYTTNGARLGKHLLNALILIFSNNDLPRHLKKENLQPCVEEILSRLVDPALSTLDQGSQLSKMMNILMVRTLQNSSPNIVFE